MEAEAKANLGQKRGKRKQSDQHSEDYLQDFFTRKFRTPDKAGQKADDESCSSHESPHDPLFMVAHAMSKMGDGTEQNAKARLIEAETRQQEVTSRAEHDKMVLDMMANMMRMQQELMQRK